MGTKRERDAAAATHFRSDRISAVNGQYFFSTREGTLEGPYFSRADAERQVQLYIDRQERAEALIARSYF